MSTPPPIPAAIVSDIPEWMTAIAVPIIAAALAAAIVLVGFGIEARQRDRQRRATFVDELSQLLIANAATRARQLNDEQLAREGMIANQYRVRAVAQMKKREYRVYDYASRTARAVLNGDEVAPQQATAMAITMLLQWLNGETRTRAFPKPGPTETVTLRPEQERR